MSPVSKVDTERRRDILRAAHEVFVELGPLAPVDQIVDRAGTDQDTLDRLFASRDGLIKAVVVDNMHQLAAHAKEAMAAEPGPWAAFTRFAHAVVGSRTVALLLTLGSRSRHDEQLAQARAEIMAAVSELLAAARREGLREDVDAGDVVLFLSLITRQNRSMPAELDTRARARLLDVVLDGLRAPGARALPDAPITADEVDAAMVAAHWRRRA